MWHSLLRSERQLFDLIHVLLHRFILHSYVLCHMIREGKDKFNMQGRFTEALICVEFSLPDEKLGNPKL